MANSDLLSRRQFLRQAGGTAAATFVVGTGLESVTGSAESRVTGYESLDRIGVQLYTVRDRMRASVEQTLEQVARIGYKEVEFAGYFGRSSKQIRAALEANGLTAPSAHSADMTAIRTRFAQVLDDAATIGHRYVICASLPNSEQTLDGYRKIAGEFNRAGELAAKSNIMVGFHNHDGEFKALGDTTGYDMLLAECDPKLVTFQMDLFWTVKAGRDPLAYFAKHPGRFSSVHVKDMAAGGAMVDVGAGQMPFDKYFAQSKQAGIRHYFVEHDSPTDPMASIAASYKHLSALKF